MLNATTDDSVAQTKDNAEQSFPSISNIHSIMHKCDSSTSKRQINIAYRNSVDTNLTLCRWLTVYSKRLTIKTNAAKKQMVKTTKVDMKYIVHGSKNQNR